MIVRRIGPDDLCAFKNIRLEALSVLPDAYASNYSDWVSLDEHGWRARMDGILVMAFDDERPVGLMGAIPDKASRMAHRARLVMVYLKAAYRGSGVATDLLTRLESEASTAGVLQLELMVNASNETAIRFYEREGFSKLALIPRAMRNDTGFMDNLLMMRALDA